MAQNADTELAGSDTGRCLNCGEALHGAFCAACGQRSVPANPTVAQLTSDAWHELSGYDGRIASTCRGLLHPGRLTLDYLQGRRATYLPPLRLYLIVSLLYFVVAAAAPNIGARSGELTGPGGIRIGVTTGDDSEMSEADRARLLKQIDGEAPWYVRPVLRAVTADREGFRARMFSTMPRVFFALLPVFAAIVALFYRGRTFPASLVFAVHLHAFAFLLFTISESSKFAGSQLLAGVVGVVSAVVFAAYSLVALRAVFGGSWLMTLAKALGIGIVYLIVSVPAFFIILLWASVV
jgi:hypothetical protein